MVRFSFIVPVYNAEKYLKRCLDALLKQSFKDFEIILIDDGSKDNSVNIIKEYQEKNRNIVLYENKENKGVSYSRNVGIQNAQGEYLVFCDADDWYAENTLEIFDKAIIKYDSDFVVANYYMAYEGKKIEINMTKIFERTEITKQECIAYMQSSSVTKAIKRELFIQNSISYPINVRRCEELPVIPVLAYKSQKPICIPDVVYYYYQNKNSASNTKVKDYSFFDVTFNEFKKELDNNYYQAEVEFRAIEQLFYSKLLVMLKSKANKNAIVQEIGNFKIAYPNFLKNKYLKNYNKAKIIFMKVLNYKMLFLAKLFARIHEKLTG